MFNVKKKKKKLLFTIFVSFMYVKFVLGVRVDCTVWNNMMKGSNRKVSWGFLNGIIFSFWYT